MRDVLAAELARANAECERLQGKVQVLQDHSKKSIMTIRDLEGRLMAYQAVSYTHLTLPTKA